MPANVENSAVTTGLEKVSFYSNPKERQCQRMLKLLCTVALISHTSKVMFKILQANFNSTWTMNFQMFKMVLEKAEEPEIKLPTSAGSLKKEESSRKTSTSVLLTTPNSLTVWITTNCKKFQKRWEYQTTLPVSWEMCMQVKKQQLESDMEKWAGSKSGKEYVKAVYCHLANLISMQSTSQEIPGWMNHKLESRLPGEILTTSDMRMIPL